LESEHVSYRIDNSQDIPRNSYINLDGIYGKGIIGINFMINGKEIYFSKEEIFDILNRLKYNA
jgi:hypothetical protein